MNINAARSTAQQRLVIEGCQISRPGPDTFVAGALTPGQPTVIWQGRASLGRTASQNRTSNGGDDRLIGTRTLRIPADVTGIQIGDRVIIPGWTDHVVTRLDDRPQVIRVLQHLEIRESTDAPGVPA